MKVISWNVNGLRACISKGFIDFAKKENADIYCMQEIKMLEGEVEIDLPGYNMYFNSAEKKGYSGTAIFSKIKPLNVMYDMGIEKHDHEGRIITLEFDKFFLVNVYVPNSKRELERLDYRMEWEDDFRKYVLALKAKKEVVICGDMNVAHKEIDLKNPKTNTRSAGFTIEERNKMSALLDSGFIDTYRYFYPDKEGAYTWWSYMAKARLKDIGWRIDYFIASDTFKDELIDSIIYKEVLGSDHCPIGLIIM